MKICLSALMMLCLALWGCAPKGTTVVLLNDPDGKTGKIRVSSTSGEQKLDSARQSTLVANNAAPSPPALMDQEKITSTFGPALSALPAQSQQFLLYFEPGTTNLTPESLLLPARILATVKERGSTDVRVNGHSDRVGAHDFNMRLSLQRAMLIRDYLIHEGISADIIAVFSHGEGNPIVPTPDEVEEPRNRRVEVLVR